MALLAVENLSFSYPQCADRALEDISFSLNRGDFMLICGATGSGKSTLLRCLKREIRPQGTLHGKILYQGQKIESLSDAQSAQAIGFVGQRPEEQLVTDKVWQELSFGLENLGLDRQLIRRRTAETACYFGLESLFERETAALSGGQKQLINLASVMAMQPDILLLDEPTAQLDPIAAENFLSMVLKLNREQSLTVILIEHRLEEALPLCGSVLALEKGRSLIYGETREVAKRLRTHPHLSKALPAATRLSACLGEEKCPLTVREGRAMLEGRRALNWPGSAENEAPSKAKPALAFSDVYFRYKREAQDVLNGLSFRAEAGEITCILGGNGSGKSTALGCAAGLLKPYAGRIEVFGRPLKSYKGQALYQGVLAMLPQDVQTLFLCSTVREELEGIDYSAFPLDFTPHMEKHPYDLSGGEQQALGLCKALALRPKLLLLDEPTKGLDAGARDSVAFVLRQLKAQGLSIVAVTHDVEFAASCADRCALFFRGEIISMQTPHAFFAENAYYSTAIGRMTRGVCDGVITVEEAARRLGGCV